MLIIIYYVNCYLYVYITLVLYHSENKNVLVIETTIYCIFGLSYSSEILFKLINRTTFYSIGTMPCILMMPIVRTFIVILNRGDFDRTFPRFSVVFIGKIKFYINEIITYLSRNVILN